MLEFKSVSPLGGLDVLFSTRRKWDLSLGPNRGAVVSLNVITILRDGYVE